VSTGVLRFPAWIQRIPEAKDTQDILGLNYYTHEYIGGNFTRLASWWNTNLPSALT